jgi:hypothetical protein
MSDYYHHFLSSMTGVGAQPPNANFNPQDAPLPLQQPPAMPLAGVPPNPYQSLGYFTGFPEPIMFNAPKSQRSRRKSAPGLDHIKHRRTRSGCYTCRSRRVKVFAAFFGLVMGLGLISAHSATRRVLFAKVRTGPARERAAVLLTFGRVQEREARMYLSRASGSKRHLLREFEGWNRPKSPY